MNSFVVANPNKCIGCKACEIACAVAHLSVTVATAGGLKTAFQPRLNLIRNSKVTMPVQCRHCEDAPCANVCPVKAIQNQDGKIIIDEGKCIGCKTCMIACPFGAMSMVELEDERQKRLKDEDGMSKAKVVAHKCDLCIGREKGPACVEICPAEALIFVQPEKIEESVKDKRLACLN